MSQTVDVPDVNLQLDFDARFLYDTATSSQSWPTAALFVRYLDSADAELGCSVFYKHDRFNDWYNSDVQHLIDVGSSDGWNHYQLNLRREIADNLPGVVAARVARIKVDIYAFCHGC